MSSGSRLLYAVAGLLLGLSSAQARDVAQAPAPNPAATDSCPGFVASKPARVIPAAFRPTALARDEVRITYIGHSTFLLESPSLVRIATDYNDYVRSPITPDIVTMNHAHSTHYTHSPDPAIAHVLRGWAAEYGKPVRHDRQLRDVRVRNVPTNIRSYGGGTERHGNSIFIFEIAGLCIAHLGHLHHTLSAQQLTEIGRVDAVMFPVDGSYTLDLEGMVEVLQALKAPLMIPMHYFSSYTLNRFLDRVRDMMDIETANVPSVVVSKATLPTRAKLLVLPGH